MHKNADGLGGWYISIIAQHHMQLYCALCIFWRGAGSQSLLKYLEGGQAVAPWLSGSNSTLHNASECFIVQACFVYAMALAVTVSIYGTMF